MFQDPLIRHIGIAVIIIIASALVGYILKHILHRIVRRLVERTATTLDERLLDVLLERVIPLSMIVGGYMATREVRSALSPEHVTHHQVLDYIEIALFVLLVVVLTRLANRLIRSTFGWYMEEISEKTHSDIAPTVAPLLSKIINIVLVLIAGMVLLDHFGINIGSLLVSLGVGSLAIALAAQETVANMIAGFVILVDQPFRVGDRIRLPSGEEGDVAQIGLRSTRILNYDGNLLVVPNGELVKNRIVNFSYPNSAVRISVEVSVSPGADMAKVKALLLEAVTNHPEVGTAGAPSVALVSIGDGSLRLQAGANIADYRKKFAVETEVRETCYAKLKEAGIEQSLVPTIVRLVS